MYYQILETTYEDEMMGKWVKTPMCVDITKIFSFRDDGDKTLVMLDTANEFGNFYCTLTFEKFHKWYYTKIEEWNKVSANPVS
jgi:hypothetical protein